MTFTTGISCNFQIFVATCLKPIQIKQLQIKLFRDRQPGKEITRQTKNRHFTEPPY